MKNLFKRKKDSSQSGQSSASSSTSTLEISGPFNVRLEHHVDFDREFGLSGVPKDWDLSNIQGINYTVDDVNSEQQQQQQQSLDRTMSEPVMVSTSTTNNNSSNSTSVATPSTSASSLFFNKLRNRNKAAHQSLSTSPVNISTNSTPTLTPEIDSTSPTTPTSTSIGANSNNLANSNVTEMTISTNSVSTPQHDRQHSQSFFSKIFTKKNSTATPQSNDESSVKNGQFVMGFTNMKKTQAGYYVEVSQLENSNQNSKFKKDKLLIDLISPENPFRLFTKMKKIGTGSTADVYKAIHVPSGKKVAIKVMPLTSVKNTNFDMIENEIFMMKHACKSYNNIFEYDITSDKTLMVQYFGTYMTVNNGIYEHIGRYLAASKRKNYHDSAANKPNKQNEKPTQVNNPYMQQQVINNSPAAKELENMAEHQRKSNDELWVTMEYVSGGKLTDLLHTRFMESEIAAMLQPILKGLHMLHVKYGVIHRDVKSDNVLITKDGKIKLADFGFCAENTGRRRSVVGTPYWMSPEVVSGAEYDEKSDVWSLGILTLELADGEVPLIEHPPIKALFLIRSQDPPTFKSSSEWSDVFHDFLKRCLEKDPTKRATIDELLEHEFIKKACKLDFLAPLLTKIRAEKKKKNIKESDIGLQVIKLRTEEEQEEEEYQEQKKKKKGIGIMGLVTSFSEMQSSSSNNNADDADNAEQGDYDLGGGGGNSGIDAYDPDLIDDPDMYCGGGDYGGYDYDQPPQEEQQQEEGEGNENNGDWNHEDAVIIDDQDQKDEHPEQEGEHAEEEDDHYGSGQYYDNDDEMLV